MRRGDGPKGSTTVVDCSGVGEGGITRVLTEAVRHWPAGHRLRLVAAPAGWRPPEGCTADVTVLSRQSGGRAATIAAAAAALHRATGRAALAGAAGPAAAVLSLSPSAAILGSRLPVATVVHDLAFRLWPAGLPAAVRRYRQVSYAAAVRRSRQLICVSERTRHDLAGLYQVPAARTSLWHPGSDLVAAPGRLPEPLALLVAAGQRYLLVAGHASHKGVELAVAALPDLPGYRLAVLTGGRRIAGFERAVAASGVADRVLFLPRLADHEYAAAMAAAAVFVMPSHFEGYGLPAVEALRLGTPTVVSPDPALHEAAGAAAVRMATWTAPALARAVVAAAAGTPPGGPPLVGAPSGGAPSGGVARSWSQATADLFELVTGEAACG